MATTIEESRQRVQLERQLIARLKTANIRFTDAQVERTWAIVSAHQAGLSIRKIAAATGLSSSRIHQLGEHFKTAAMRPSSEFPTPVRFAFPDTSERRSPGVGY